MKRVQNYLRPDAGNSGSTADLLIITGLIYSVVMLADLYCGSPAGLLNVSGMIFGRYSNVSGSATGPIYLKVMLAACKNQRAHSRPANKHIGIYSTVL